MGPKKSGMLPSDQRLRNGLWRWISIAIIVLSILVIAWTLPLTQALNWLQGRTAGLGSAGPVIFTAAYVGAALLFVPGSALTIAAGVVFGLVRGTIVVSIASTLAAAAAFLIGRHVARGSVERMARRYPRFSAIDEAVGEGGWKIVSLLRLSPLVPFSASNYLFGLTPMRFWPYVLASWLAMLPGTLLYVYLGHIGARGVTAATGASGRTPGEWALLGFGLIATAVVTVYLTLIARRRLRKQVGSKNTIGHREDRQAPDAADTREAQGSSVGATALLLLALLLAAGAATAVLNRDRLQSVFGPPVVQMKEVYEPKAAGPAFDHGRFDTLLRRHVLADGWVDYEGLRNNSAELDAYIASLEAAPFEPLGRDEKLALLVNGYNAFTLKLILDKYPVKSIMDIPDDQRWDDRRWKLAGSTWSLNQIEHEQIRPKFKEPRIHFALVCAAVGCPPLRNEAYVGKRLEVQLEDQMRFCHSHMTWFRFDEKNKTAYLTPLYQWYGGDFTQVSGSVLDYAASYASTLQAALQEKAPVRIQWLNYDWRLNSIENRQDR